MTKPKTPKPITLNPLIMLRTCPHCGKQWIAQIRYCPYCAHTVEERIAALRADRGALRDEGKNHATS